MPHGSPDYGEYAALETIGRMVDLGELAVRLGSISHYNREGNVVYQDNFEANQLRWGEFHTGTAGTVGISNDYSLSGNQSAKIVTGPNQWDSQYIAKDFAILANVDLGCEFAYMNIGTDLRIRHMLYVVKDEMLYAGLFEHWLDDGLVKIYTPDGYKTIKTDYFIEEENWLFHHYKLVIDLEKKKYVRLLCDITEIDLTEYALNYVDQSGVQDLIELQIGLYNNLAGSHTGYIDNLIFTQNEI